MIAPRRGAALLRSMHRPSILFRHSEGGLCPRNLSWISNRIEIHPARNVGRGGGPHSADFVWNGVFGLGLITQEQRQAAALQNVGMPTFKVLLEVRYWNCSSGLTPLPRRDKPAATGSGRCLDWHEVGA